MREMKNSDNNHHSRCGYGEHLVSFLYGEIEGAEKAGFEAHLPGCAVCADEIAGFSAVRSSIQDWRTTDFVRLAPPAFEMPSVENEKRVLFTPWLESIRAFFTQTPVWASVTLMPVFLLVGVLFWLMSGSPKTNDIAANLKENNHKPVSVPEAPTRADVLPTETAAANEKNEAAVNKTHGVASTKNKPEEEISVPSAKNSDRKINNNRQTVRVKKSVPAAVNEGTNKEMAKTPQPRKTKIPSLAIDEDEDNSLRLSDLLKEISLE